MNEKFNNFGSRIVWKMALWPILLILFSKTHSKISILAKYKKVLLWKYIVLTYFLHAYKTYLFYLSNLISCFKSYILQWVNQSIVSLLSNIKIKKKNTMIPNILRVLYPSYMPFLHLTIRSHYFTQRLQLLLKSIWFKFSKSIA